MPSIHFNQQQAMLRTLDSNSNRKLEELEVSGELKARVDSDSNGELSLDEVATALRADTVDLQGKTLVPGKSKQIMIHNLETLKNIHSMLDRTLSSPHVWAPRVSDNVGAAIEIVGLLAGAEDKRTPAQRRRDEERELNASSTAYLLAVSSMRSTLRSVEDMTSGGGDARSKQLNQQAKSSLSSSGAWTAGSLVGGLIFGSAHAENVAIQGAYNVAKGTMVSMREQTKNLPDPAKTVSDSDKALSQGQVQIARITKLQASDSRSQQLTKQASEAEAKVTGRIKPYALTGSLVGAAAGAAAGYFLAGRTLKAAAIGAGVGAGGSAALGAIIGGSMDAHYTDKAKSLREQAEAIKTYKPELAQKQLDQASLKLYEQLREASEIHDLDRATVIDTQLKDTQKKIELVVNKANEVARLYDDKK